MTEASQKPVRCSAVQCSKVQQGTVHCCTVQYRYVVFLYSPLSPCTEITPEVPEIIHNGGFDSTWMHSSYYDMRAFMKERRSLRKLQSLLTLHPGYTQTTQVGDAIPFRAAPGSPRPPRCDMQSLGAKTQTTQVCDAITRGTPPVWMWSGYTQTTQGRNTITRGKSCNPSLQCGLYRTTHTAK